MCVCVCVMCVCMCDVCVRLSDVCGWAWGSGIILPNSFEHWLACVCVSCVGSIAQCYGDVCAHACVRVCACVRVRVWASACVFVCARLSRAWNTCFCYVCIYSNHAHIDFSNGIYFARSKISTGRYRMSRSLPARPCTSKMEIWSSIRICVSMNLVKSRNAYTHTSHRYGDNDNYIYAYTRASTHLHKRSVCTHILMLSLIFIFYLLIYFKSCSVFRSGGHRCIGTHCGRQAACGSPRGAWSEYPRGYTRRRGATTSCLTGGCRCRCCGGKCRCIRCCF